MNTLASAVVLDKLPFDRMVRTMIKFALKTAGVVSALLLAVMAYAVIEGEPDGPVVDRSGRDTCEIAICENWGKHYKIWRAQKRATQGPAIEARRAETSGSSVHESAVAKGEPP